MNIFKLIFLILIILNFQISKSNDLDKLRKSYLNASKSKQNCIDFLTLTNNTKFQDCPTLKAYKISATLISLKFINNPIKKLKIFKKNTDKLNILIKNNPMLLEIRLLRYLIQTNSPKFLSYNSNIDEDLKFIRNNVFFENKKIQNFMFSTINL